VKRSDLKELLERVFEEAAPYLHDIRWARKFIEKNLMSLSRIESVIAVLEDEISRETLETRKTDLRILIDYVKSIAKGGEHYG